MSGNSRKATPLERAVELSPNNAEAHWVLGTALPVVGRLQDGFAALRRALELDPLRVEYFGWATRLLLYAKDYDAAMEQGAETFEIDENYGRGFVFVGSAHLAMGDAEPRSTGSSVARASTPRCARTTP